jgi:4-hydroxy-tetrahydrodipicolinate synthase
MQTQPAKLRPITSAPPPRRPAKCSITRHLAPQKQALAQHRRSFHSADKSTCMTQEPSVYCMSVTPFAGRRLNRRGRIPSASRPNGEAGVAVYLGSPGSGEGHSLSHEELRSVYQLGVAACRGKVPVCANPPESRNPAEALTKARIAVDAGIDVVQLYPLDAGHGMRPTLVEQETYYRLLLDQLDHPIGLSVNALAGGYGAPVSLFKRLCGDYRKIVLINVNQPPTSYLAELMEAVGPRVAFYTAAEMLAEGLTLGAKGCLTGQANVAPHLIASIGTHFAKRRIAECGRALTDVFRFNRAVGSFGLDQTVQQQWSPRWIKAAMKILGQPGHGDGRMRPPYRSPSLQEIQELPGALESIDLRAWSSARKTRRPAPNSAKRESFRNDPVNTTSLPADVDVWSRGAVAQQSGANSCKDELRLPRHRSRNTSGLSETHEDFKATCQLHCASIPRTVEWMKPEC